MTHQRALIVVLILVAASIVTALFVLPRIGKPKVLSGYVEGEALYLAAPVAGTVRAVNVVRGQQVAPGQALFVGPTAYFHYGLAWKLARPIRLTEEALLR